METNSLPTMAFLDVETTGLSALYDDRVCEIAVLRCEGNKTTEWQTLVNPLRTISPGAAAINGITEKMVRDAPTFAEIADRLLEMIDGAVVVCHNVAFDLSFLSAEMENCGRIFPNTPALDTLRIARQYFDFPSNSLGNIAAYLNIEVKEKHRAMADVHTTHKIFAWFWKELQQQGVTQLDQLFTSHIWFPRRGKTVLALPPIIEEAIRFSKNVRLSYLSRDGEATERVVKPLKLVNESEYPCLEAFCQLRKEKRTFRLDRIIKIAVLSS